MKTTKIKKCTCKHKVQDKWYGKKKRVMNLTEKSVRGDVTYRCTVCRELRQGR